MTLAEGDGPKVMLPFWIAGAGVVAAVVGYFAVSVKDGANQHQLMFALHKGTLVSSVLVCGFSAVIIWAVFQGRETARRAAVKPRSDSFPPRCGSSVEK